MSPNWSSFLFEELDAPKLFLDVETPNARNDRICSICAVTDQGHNFYTLVDPETEFHRVNTLIHGITPEMVFDKPNFRAVWEYDLARLVEDRTIVGYNVTYDLRVLTKTLEAYGITAPVWNYIDVLPAARRYFDLPSYSLDDVAKELGVSFKHHNAQEDVMATKIVYERINADAPDLLREKVFTFEQDEPPSRW